MIFNTILAFAGASPYNAVNQLAEKPTGIFALLPLLIGLVLGVGGCAVTPPVMAYLGLNQKKPLCISAWVWCYIVIAVVITIGLVGTIVRAGGTYTNFCDIVPEGEGTSICEKQFKYQDTCNHTAPNPFSAQAPPVNVRVTKKYCDSKGMDYEGAWFSEIVSHIFQAIFFILTNAVTWWICMAKKDIEGAAGQTNGGVIVTTTTATVVTVATPQIVQMTKPVVVNAQPVIVKASM
jgi:hypothetical protein